LDVFKPQEALAGPLVRLCCPLNRLSQALPQERWAKCPALLGEASCIQQVKLPLSLLPE
jgi:hypothetical protein